MKKLMAKIVAPFKSEISRIEPFRSIIIPKENVAELCKAVFTNEGLDVFRILDNQYCAYTRNIDELRDEIYVVLDTVENSTVIHLAIAMVFNSIRLSKPGRVLSDEYCSLIKYIEKAIMSESQHEEVCELYCHILHKCRGYETGLIYFTLFQMLMPTLTDLIIDYNETQAMKS